MSGEGATWIASAPPRNDGVGRCPSGSTGSGIVLPALRRAVAALEPASVRNGSATFGFGLPVLDDWLGGGLARACLHEVHAARWADAAAAAGFALALALRAGQGRPLVWVRPDFAGLETGQPYGAGVAALGIDPEGLLVVRARDPTGALRAAAETARCAGVGAALVEIWGEPRVLDLTASRRLALAAAASGVTLVMVRLQAAPAPSAAATRWRVAAHPSQGLEANAPGLPAFEATLLRHRAGLGPKTWRLEWDRDRASFAESPLPRPVVPVPVHGPAPARAEPVVPFEAPCDIPSAVPAAVPSPLPWRRAG